jgi:hypothetical protein
MSAILCGSSCSRISARTGPRCSGAGRFANYSGQVGSGIAGFAKLNTMLHNFDERDLTGRQFDNAWSSIRSTLLIFVALCPFAVGGLL